MGTHITIRMEGDRERFGEANEGFLITADCQETVMSVEAWTMVAGDLRSVRAGGIPHISTGKCLAASSGAFGPLLSSGYPYFTIFSLVQYISQKNWTF